MGGENQSIRNDARSRNRAYTITVKALLSPGGGWGGGLFNFCPPKRGWFIREGGLIEGGGLITRPDCQGGGGLITEGGLIEVGGVGLIELLPYALNPGDTNHKSRGRHVGVPNKSSLINQNYKKILESDWLSTGPI